MKLEWIKIEKLMDELKIQIMTPSANDHDGVPPGPPGGMFGPPPKPQIAPIQSPPPGVYGLVKELRSLVQ